MNEQLQIPDWLPELSEMVRTDLARIDSCHDDQQPDLESEVGSLREKRQGWMASLANKLLDKKVREALESEWAAAEARMDEIEHVLLARDNRQQNAGDAVDADAVLQRLQTLSDVLTNYGPTRANLELSLHIDRIVCHSDGRIEMRICKLGALPEVAELLADLPPNGEIQAYAGNGRSDSQNGKRTRGPRRRGRLRTSGGPDDFGGNSREVADFAADTHRFAGLSDKWFWVDEFQIPVRRSWVEENADEVLRRRDDIEKVTGKKPSLNALAREFKTSRPTITRAIEIATGELLRREERPREKRKFTMPLEDETRKQIIQLYHEERLPMKEVGARCDVHRSTVERILNDWDAQRGEKRADGRKHRKRKPLTNKKV
jgi:AraC-like DNA-binding protein